MFCRKNQWDAQKFPRELFGQSKSKRGRVLMHSKVRLFSSLLSFSPFHPSLYVFHSPSPFPSHLLRHLVFFDIECREG